jgi:malto-oligosyltrehalose trehalohydrolase
MIERRARAFGAELSATGVRFRLWAPASSSVVLRLDRDRLAMEAQSEGWFELFVAGARAGGRYCYEIEEMCVPDPASRFQPDGVHSPSEIVDAGAYRWRRPEWSGRPWHETVLYELHVGTFTETGTFRAVIERLDGLRDLGVNAIELMPVAQAAGNRGWGYDGVFPFAPSGAYGRPDDLRALIDAAHARGIAVFLDVVYNHFGPEGNYLHRYAPEFFTDRHHTPWGKAINFDGPQSETVRRFFVENALYWLEEFRFDGLRLDAVHEVRDDSERHILVEIAESVRDEIPAERNVHLILENDDNAARFLGKPHGKPLYDAQWNDDAHHAAHVALSGEHWGYYRDYRDPVRELARALTEGFVYQGELSEHRGGKPRGEKSAHLSPTSFVDFLQNHDQVGNRALGERLTMLAPWHAVRAAASIFLLAPSIPMLFMGEEWGASTPFLFFCDFSGDLARAVTEGRGSEFPGGPDPNDPATFERSKLPWDEVAGPTHREILAFYRDALAARRAHIIPLLRTARTSAAYDMLAPRVIHAWWTFEESVLLTLRANLSDEPYAGAECNLAPWRVEWSIGRDSDP